MLDIRIADSGDVALIGRVDAAQAARVESALSRVERSTTVDLTHLEYISSIGLSVFVRTQMRLQENGHALRLVHLQPRVLSVFQIAGLAPVFGLD